ncbi:ABC-2 type transport system ATP-binding protein [Halobacillus dabanensis]|uniref:ABC-2 type transport system ATP-binding protein n=1 Tax=Halobacillus dabanensis TaxID=240302 RepID=A0A1I3XT28_HALDA|nr:ABC transporter ATP-binding protein [Halobacillus dabanensis]SFK22662.1 ABC-2 type transport system ATP-binding protein [Halobacillus dabanensis]
MIKAKELTKMYDKGYAVKNVSFELSPGKCVALLGPNGAGKTTTLKMISGLIAPTKGEVKFSEKKGGDIRQHIGYLPQHPQYHGWMTAVEFLVYVAQLSHISKKEAIKQSDRLLKRVGIAEAKNKRIAKFSGGMKQRLGIAQALIHKPKVLLLDEPVSALDPIGRRDVLNLMEELKQETTLLYSTHILSDAEEASDEILLMHKGTIVESGPLHQVKKQNQIDKISLRFTENMEVYADQIANMETVTKTEVKKQVLHVHVNNIHLAREQLLEKANEEKWPLLQFEVGQTTLEDLFMKVVNEHAMEDNL